MEDNKAAIWKPNNRCASCCVMGNLKSTFYAIHSRGAACFTEYKRLSRRINDIRINRYVYNTFRSVHV